MAMHCSNWGRLVVVGCVMAVCFAVPALAQNTDRVVISLGACPHGRITVVVNGDEEGEIDNLTLRDGYWIGRYKETFDAENATASLRLDGARTDCETSVPMKDKDKDN